MDNITMHQQLCTKLHDIYKKKNADYGDSFSRSFAKRGITAAMVRLEDKWNRLDHLALNSEQIAVKEESIQDTLLDMANYCLLTYMELEKEKERKEALTTKADVARAYAAYGSTTPAIVQPYCITTATATGTKCDSTDDSSSEISDRVTLINAAKVSDIDETFLSLL